MLFTLLTGAITERVLAGEKKNRIFKLPRFASQFFFSPDSNMTIPIVLGSLLCRANGAADDLREKNL